MSTDAPVGCFYDLPRIHSPTQFHLNMRLMTQC